MWDGTILSNFYILSVIQFVCSFLVWVFCGMILEGFIRFAWILLVYVAFEKEEYFYFYFRLWIFPWWRFCFLFPVWLISVQNGGFWHAVWVFGWYLSRLSFYHLLVSLSRQDCRRTWALLECLELWTELVEPQGFVICALLLGTTSDATPHDTMIFE